MWNLFSTVTTIIEENERENENWYISKNGCCFQNPP